MSQRVFFLTAHRRSMFVEKQSKCVFSDRLLLSRTCLVVEKLCGAARLSQFQIRLLWVPVDSLDFEPVRDIRCCQWIMTSERIIP